MYNKNATAQVTRLVYTNGKTTGQSVVASYEWYLTPMNAHELIDPKMYGKMYHFTVDMGADIKESDTLTIDNVKYSVQSALVKKGRIVAFIRCVLIKNG